MKLSELLIAEKKKILNEWFERVLATYPDRTGVFLRSQKNPFNNPVGNAIAKDMETVYGLLMDGMDKPIEAPPLENVVQIRAVQDFTPARALAFIFELKDVVRKVLENEITKETAASELHAFDRKVDEMALLSFNIYSAYRERIFQVRYNEMKTRSARLLQRAGLLAELEEDQVNPQGEDVNSLN